MKLKSVQWNIGGGKVIEQDGDINLLASYNDDGLDEIIEVLKSIDADVITLQEVHKDDTLNQAEYIAKSLGMQYCVSDFYADSHIEEGQKLGHAIMSKYPISEHYFQLYNNPQLEIVWEDGSTAISHDKGFTRCNIDIRGVIIEAFTTHFSPFRRFGVVLDSETGQSILHDIQTRLAFTADNVLLQGDFNIDSSSLKQWLPILFKKGLTEVLQVDSTTPKDQRLDHVLYKGLKVVNTEVDPSVATDHYPVITEFEVS